MTLPNITSSPSPAVVPVVQSTPTVPATPVQPTPTPGSTMNGDQVVVNTSMPAVNDLDYGDMPFGGTQSLEALAALDRLTPKQRAEYEQVREMLLEAGNVEALEALERLLIRADSPLTQGEDPHYVLYSLARMVVEPMRDVLTQALAPENVNARLLSDVVKQLDKPELIRQARGEDTCGEASLEMTQAVERPAEYARMMIDMASKNVPNVRFNDSGKDIVTAIDADTLDGRRSFASNMFQHSLKTTWGDDVATFARLIERANKENGLDFVTFTPEHAAAALEHLEPGSIVLLPTAVPGESHAYVFEGFDPDTGNAMLRDPLTPAKAPVSMPRAELETKIQGAALKQGHGIPEAHLDLEVGYGGAVQSQEHYGGSTSTRERKVAETTDPIKQNSTDTPPMEGGRLATSAEIVTETENSLGANAVSVTATNVGEPGVSEAPTEEVKSTPTAEEPKPEPAAEEPKPEPVVEEPKPEPAAEEPKPEPAAEEPKPEPAAEEPKPEPAAEEPKPEPAAEEPKPEPAAEEPKPEPAAEEPKPEPVVAGAGGSDDIGIQS